MASTPQTSFSVPFRDQLTTSIGLLSRPWEYFFRSVYERLLPLGVERSFEILNNQSSAKDIAGLNFSAKGVSVAFVDYLIQRVTKESSPGAGDDEELIEAGTFILTYNPASEDWTISNDPSSAGVTITVTASGQGQYVSSEVTGTKVISKFFWRARTLAGKSALYSSVGAR